MTAQESDGISRIKHTLAKASKLAKTFTHENMVVEHKENLDPVTEADRSLNELLRTELVRGDEGWLSEETADDGQRLTKSAVWVVDPIDGTREFIVGLPEWVVSVALVKNHHAVAAGILNPSKDELFIGTARGGFTVNGKPAGVTDPASLEGAKVLASRREIRDGRWEPLMHSALEIIPTGSIAYKLAMVAAGWVDATISLAPKHEWDVAAGVLLVQAAGGRVTDLDGRPIHFNQPNTLLNGVIAAGPRTFDGLWNILKQIR